MHKRYVTGQLDAEMVLTESLVEYLRADMERRWQECLDAGASFSQFDGHVPCDVFVMDDTTFIRGESGSGEACELIESQNAAVLSWAHSLIETFRTDAEAIDAAAFSDNHEVPADYID